MLTRFARGILRHTDCAPMLHLQAHRTRTKAVGGDNADGELYSKIIIPVRESRSLGGSKVSDASDPGSDLTV